MKRLISSVLAAVMMLTLLAGIVCLPVSAFNAADWGECTLWSVPQGNSEVVARTSQTFAEYCVLGWICLLAN